MTSPTQLGLQFVLTLAGGVVICSAVMLSLAAMACAAGTLAPPPEPQIVEIIERCHAGTSDHLHTEDAGTRLFVDMGRR